MQAGCAPSRSTSRATDYNLDLDRGRGRDGPRRAALLPVHLYGQLADMRRLTALAERRGLLVVEDACQAHGASAPASAPASNGEGAAFSFYPGKNLGAIGDAGALVDRRRESPTPSGRSASTASGRSTGTTGSADTARLDAIQALVLPAQAGPARGVERRAAGRRAIYARHCWPASEISCYRGSLPTASPSGTSTSSEQATPPRSPAFLRDALDRDGPALPEPAAPDRGVRRASATARGVPRRRGAWPVRCLSLPIFPGMAETQVEAVAAAVEEYFRSS